MKKPEKDSFDCIIGRDEHGGTHLLIAPLFSSILVGDVVKTAQGIFTVVFQDYNHTADDALMTALFVMNGIKPQKIMKKIEEVAIEWRKADDDG